MRNLTSSLALAASAFVATLAVAQLPPLVGPMMRADANHDGTVTKAEALAEADARFAQMDADHDGTVTAAERQSYRAALRDRTIALGGPRGTTGGAANGPHGQVELAPMPDTVIMAGSGSDRLPAPPRPTPADARVGNGRDQSITAARFHDMAARRFDRADTNHDGKLDSAELSAERPMRGPGGKRGGALPPPQGE